jgi:hypothetical protein
MVELDSGTSVNCLLDFDHHVDVRALLRIAALYSIPIACNRSTADFIISSLAHGPEVQTGPEGLHHLHREKLEPRLSGVLWQRN